jgi:hypothetical protein
VNLQAMVRGEVGREGFAAGQALAKEVRTAGHNASLTGSPAYACRAQSSAPLYLGMDEKGHPLWSQNFVAWKEE